MKKDQMYLILGILVLIVPLTGFSRDFKNILVYICGFLITVISLISIYRKSKYNKPRGKSEIFTENKPKTQDENASKFEDQKPL